MSTTGVIASESDLFISYSHEDKTIGQELKDRLANTYPDGEVSIFFDQNIDNGVKWRENIYRSLDTASMIVVIVSPASLRSLWVSDEWHYALHKRDIMPYWIYWKNIEERDLNYVKDYQFPINWCFNGEIAALRTDDGQSLLDWHTQDIARRLSALENFKKWRAILLNPDANTDEQSKVAWELGQAKTLRSTALRYLLQAVEFQMSGKGYGPVQSSIAHALGVLGFSEAIPALWRLGEMADDTVKNVVKSGITRLSCK